MKMNKILLAVLGIIILTFTACEDVPTIEYKKQTVVQAYIFVDKPISGIEISNTMPVDSKYDKKNAQIKDAKVQISYFNEAKNQNDTLNLIYKDTDDFGYYYPDANFKVLPATVYYLNVVLNDGTVITGHTFTPKRFSWIVEPLPELNYPKDTLKLPGEPKYNISWTDENKSDYYFIRVMNLDTNEYGKYLAPPIPNELNRRCYNIFSGNNEDNAKAYYKNVTTWNLIGNNSTPTVWIAFKWFGKHLISTYSPDDNLLNWFKNIYFTGSSENDPLLSTVKGENAYGVFGSAAVIEKEVFLYKNQK
jgi:hypothetical protein